MRGSALPVPPLPPYSGMKKGRHKAGPPSERLVQGLPQNGEELLRDKAALDRSQPIECRQEQRGIQCALGRLLWAIARIQEQHVGDISGRQRSEETTSELQS